MSDRTRLKARALNRRRARDGPAGDLTALRFAGESEDDENVYSSLKVYAAVEDLNGWGVETVRGEDGALFTRIRIADEDAALAALVDGDGGLTDFAVGVTIFRVEPDETFRPVIAPFVWEFRCYVDTKHTYEPEP